MAFDRSMSSRALISYNKNPSVFIFTSTSEHKFITKKDNLLQSWSELMFTAYFTIRESQIYSVFAVEDLLR